MNYFYLLIGTFLAIMILLVVLMFAIPETEPNKAFEEDDDEKEE